MFLKGKKDFSIEINGSWLIGDSKSDILVGQKAGCKTILINKKLYKNDILIDKDKKHNFIIVI